MIIHGKVWGRTSPVFHLNNVEIHHLFINKGGYCSLHKHNAKFNKFVILKGKLEVSIVKDYGTVKQEDKSILYAGDEITVNPGELHKFNALEECEVLEIYWVTLDINDIERKTHGGASLSHNADELISSASGQITSLL